MLIMIRELSKLPANKLTREEQSNQDRLLKQSFDQISKKLKTLPQAPLPPFKSDSTQGRPPKPFTVVQVQDDKESHERDDELKQKTELMKTMLQDMVKDMKKDLI